MVLLPMAYRHFCYRQLTILWQLPPHHQPTDRNQASLLMQFRTKYIPLNVILHQIKCLDTPNCLHCKNGICETIHHFILTCPHYINARNLLCARLKCDASSIPFLLGAQNGDPHFLCCISNTNCPKGTFGEVWVGGPGVYSNQLGLANWQRSVRDVDDQKFLRSLRKKERKEWTLFIPCSI